MAGVVAMIFLSKVRMATYRRWSLVLLGVSIFLLAVVWIPHIGTKTNGARRWLSLGFTTFQPSEIAKIAVVLFFSSHDLYVQGADADVPLRCCAVHGRHGRHRRPADARAASVGVHHHHGACDRDDGLSAASSSRTCSSGMGSAGALLLIASKSCPMCTSASCPGATRLPIPARPATRSCSRCIRSARAAFSASASARAGRSISICPRNTMTTSFPSSVRSSAMSAPLRS